MWRLKNLSHKQKLISSFQNSHKLGQYAKFAQNQEIDTRAI